MLTTRKKNKRRMWLPVVMILAVAIMLSWMPQNAYAAKVRGNPDMLNTPGRLQEFDDGVDALKEKIAALEKIVKLNVPRAEKIPVLLYHHLMKESDMTAAQKKNSSIISIELFTEHMKFLYDNKYYTATVSELEQYLEGKLLLPEKTVVITFDDGYRSNTKFAYPILKKYDFKAAIFLITGLIGEKVNVIEHADWADMKKCGDVFSYHSHTHDLHKTKSDGKSTLITSGSDLVETDLLMSKALLSTSFFAYPYGQSSRTVTNALKNTGYRMAFTTVADYTARGVDRYAIPRFTITPEIDMEAFESICTLHSETGDVSVAEEVR